MIWRHRKTLRPRSKLVFPQEYAQGGAIAPPAVVAKAPAQSGRALDSCRFSGRGSPARRALPYDAPCPTGRSGVPVVRGAPAVVRKPLWPPSAAPRARIRRAGLGPGQPTCQPAQTPLSRPRRLRRVATRRP